MESVVTAGHSAKSGALDILHVFGKYIFPLIGIFVGYGLATALGGANYIANIFIAGIGIVSGSAPDWGTRVARLLMGGIWGAAGAFLWTKGGTEHIVGMIIRFVGATFVGMAVRWVLGAVAPSTITGGDGLIDAFAYNLSGGVNYAVSTGGG